MSRASRIALVLGISSLWQAVSGYVDVYSHRFIFNTVDPTLNPAHISIYAASLLGLLAVFFGLRKVVSSHDWAAVVPGLLVARFGAVGEVFAGISNEVYHRIFAGVSSNDIFHLSIHGLFVVSMFVVAVGGLLSAMTLGAIQAPPDLAAAGSGFASYAAVWLIAAGSISYLAGEFLSAEKGLLYLAVGGFVISAVAVSGLLATRTVALLVVAVTVFYLSNGLVLFVFAGEVFLLPFPVLGAIVAELVVAAGRLRSLSPPTRSILIGGLVGVLSYWMLYPFSFFYYDNAIFPDPMTNPKVAVVILAGIAGGLLAAAVNRRLATMVKKRYLRAT